MSKQKIYISLITIIITIMAVYTWINQPMPSLKKLKTEAKVDALLLTQSFLKNEKNTNEQFKGKVIEITGTIKQINSLNDQYNIILKGIHPNTNVICELQASKKATLNTLQMEQQIIIKGMCKGFLKDVILLNCMLVNTNNNE